MNKNLRNLESQLKRHWEKNLKTYGVIYPTEKKLYQLLCLFESLSKPVSQEKITNWHIKYGLGDYNKQARHIADLGWDIRSGNSRFSRGVQDTSLKRDELLLFSYKTPNPIWDRNNQLRINNLGEDEWEEILSIFSERGCAVCGEKMSSYDKGHLDRTKSYERGNIVPMCVDCNNWGAAKNVDFKLTNKNVARPKIKKQ
ncbi:MAG: hypothetical protein P8J35_01680 [Candidatus Marinimicrobia bacterium]|nr:hypothetical protein [Candidatus Neomarinimicrobiota bacterium]